ncbi:MAG: Stf0 family sulfotransferase [Pseudomonadota bacterium]
MSFDRVKAALAGRPLVQRIAGHFDRPFRHGADRPKLRQRLQAQAAPSRRYVILFTPRSGSSRLTDLLTQAGGLSLPGEPFNPAHLPRIAQQLGARNLQDYLDLLMRKRATNGVFGAEITMEHLVRCFGNHRRFLSHYQPTAILFLVRKDLLDQAISLSRMAQTGESHRIDTAQGDTGVDFNYRPQQIRSFLHRLLTMERRAETLLAESAIEPLRLSYELTSQVAPEELIRVIAGHIGARPATLLGLDSIHQKLSDERSAEFHRRFTQDHPSHLAKIAQARRVTLAQLEWQQTQCFPATARQDRK